MTETAKDKAEWIIGLMSGTSMDGIDAALVKTDGNRIDAYGPFEFTPFTDQERNLLRSVLGGQGDIDAASQLVTEKHAEAVLHICKTAQEQGVIPALVGFHGQTIDHKPEIGETWQIGDGAELARLTGLPVVWDFRSEDMRQGGQGAPLVPVYHKALGAGFDRAQVFVNIGGVSNVTWIGRDGTLMAFDTGPGNALMDDCMKRHLDKDVDEGGRVAASGQILETALRSMLDHPFFLTKPPKSLDRNSFNVTEYLGNDISDNMATLAAFTAETIASSAEFMPETPSRWVICGGGRHNDYLMSLLADYLPGKVLKAEDIDLRGDAIEAEAFAILAACVKHDLPTSWPGTTGCSAPVSGGIMSQP